MLSCRPLSSPPFPYFINFLAWKVSYSLWRNSVILSKMFRRRPKCSRSAVSGVIRVLRLWKWKVRETKDRNLFNLLVRAPSKVDLTFWWKALKSLDFILWKDFIFDSRKSCSRYKLYERLLALLKHRSLGTISNVRPSNLVSRRVITQPHHTARTLRENLVVKFFWNI